MLRYDHLPLRFGPDSMTTLGVPVSQLDMTYKVSLNHTRPLPVGRDRANRGAYVVFPTWTFLSVSQSEAALLVILLAQHMRIHNSMWAHQPATSLFWRLLNATHRTGKNPNERVLSNFLANFPADHWHAHAHKMLLTPNAGIPEDVLVERAEAADLCVLLASSADQRPRLMEALMDAAIPETLFARTAHGQIDFIGRRARIPVEGRAALPDAFLAS